MNRLSFLSHSFYALLYTSQFLTHISLTISLSLSFHTQMIRTTKVWTVTHVTYITYWQTCACASLNKGRLVRQCPSFCQILMGVWKAGTGYRNTHKTASQWEGTARITASQINPSPVEIWYRIVGRKMIRLRDWEREGWRRGLHAGVPAAWRN